MATSQNGWTAFASGLHPKLRTSKWVTGRVRRGDAAFVLDYVAAQFDKRVEPIRKDWSWGFAARPIRGAKSGLSNHASGTAYDFNAPKHGLGDRGTFSSAQVREIREFLDEVDDVVRWGGDYQNRPDEMHFEINASAARVKAVADRLRAKPKPLPAGRRYVVTADRLWARRHPSLAAKVGRHKNITALRSKGFRFTGTQVAVDPVSGRTFIRAIARWYDASHLDLLPPKKG